MSGSRAKAQWCCTKTSRALRTSFALIGTRVAFILVRPGQQRCAKIVTDVGVQVRRKSAPCLGCASVHEQTLNSPLKRRILAGSPRKRCKSVRVAGPRCTTHRSTRCRQSVCLSDFRRAVPRKWLVPTAIVAPRTVPQAAPSLYGKPAGWQLDAGRKAWPACCQR